MRIKVNQNSTKLPPLDIVSRNSNNPLITWLRDNIGPMVESESWLRIRGDGWFITYEMDDLQPWNTAMDLKLIMVVRFDRPISDLMLSDFCLRFT